MSSPLAAGAIPPQPPPSASPVAVPAFPVAGGQGQLGNQNRGEFHHVIGHLPFMPPNIRAGQESIDLPKIVDTADATDWVSCVLCSLTGVGACYVCCKSGLIQEGRYGLVIDNGRPRILFPGYYTLPSPFASLVDTVSAGQDIIRVGPVSIIRVPLGSYGFATNNGIYEILTPGLHARNQGTWKFLNVESQDQVCVVQGPIKLLTVRSGCVRICYRQGKVHIYPEGRYAINDATFLVDREIPTTQQNVRFEKHTVLLDGGISMMVEGLLTYQVIDVERLVKELGDRDLNRAIEDVTKAELARVFAAIHLEQISSTHAGKEVPPPTAAQAAATRSIMNTDGTLANATSSTTPGGTRDVIDEPLPGTVSRSRICQQVMEYTQPLVSSWGVALKNFQLESTKIADSSYAREYEEASLGMAKAKANLRSVEAENNLLLQRARATANAAKIEAEGKGQAVIIAAEAEASARTIEAVARNEAAEAMTDDFARKYALNGVQVDFAAALKANVLTIVPSGVLGQPLMSLTGQPLVPSAQMSR
jgi:regulator of protease activity HflC (stomatin/prohibitin superfamily)